jgi:hypothetical protein
MSRSLSYLRRGLLGLASVGSLGFGATQALASPDIARSGSCQLTWYEYYSLECNAECWQYGGYCDGVNTECICFGPPPEG